MFEFILTIIYFVFFILFFGIYMFGVSKERYEQLWINALPSYIRHIVNNIDSNIYVILIFILCSLWPLVLLLLIIEKFLKKDE